MARLTSFSVLRGAVALIVSLPLLLLAPAPASAWDTQLTRAIMQVHLGTASEAQLALVRANNHVVNNMASTGHLRDHVYQKVQADFARFNAEVATNAARNNGLDLNTQKATKAASPGTDSDFITSSNSGKMDVRQIEGSIRDYNTEMNRRLGTQNVDYAKRLNTDFMANPNQMSADDFAKVSKLNNDAYKKQGAASYEAKVRTPGETVTASEIVDYQKDMRDLIGKKSGQIKDLQGRLSDALRADPSGIKPETRNLKAELQIRQQQQAKYIERFTEATRLTAETYGVAAPEGSPIAQEGADRSLKPGEGQLESDKVRANQKAAAKSSSLADYQTGKATGESVRVNVEASGNIEAQAGRIPDRGRLMGNAADQLTDLPPSQQGEVIDDVRRRFGDDAARELTERARAANSAKAAAGRTETLKANAKAAAEKIAVVSAIAGLANEVRAWVKGEKSNWEAAETAADMVSQGLYNTGKNLAGWKETYDLNKSAFTNETQARIFRIAKELHDRGVDLADVKRIVADMENGSEASLDGQIKELAAKGVAYTKPAPVERTTFSDRSWTDYAKEQGGVAADIVKGILVAPVKLAWDTGKDLGELVLITSDIYKAHKNISDADLEIIEQQNTITRKKLIRRLTEMGADPREAEAAVDAWFDGKSEGIEKLRGLRDKLRGDADVSAAAPEAKPVSPEEIAKRRAHIVDRLAKLNHTKLTAALEGMGIAPPVDFYNCLCRAAAYGSSSAAQFYHPDTIGEYNPRYSCSHPGDPCIVSGFGCGRYPLPSDAKIWTKCIARNRVNPTLGADGKPVPGSGTSLDEAIEQALRQRKRP
ncbi:hypothetical protein KKP04_03985 [Rhodomicrobium sp. Az07]|uniref:hypothetical protein n=1 Tax=Rhodomicrobium sp. Az07 TaxID=2839034 RepID=UPI001BE791D3|nr:hypothetical protein [Rhodomicrobium sp. Az07]MBT3070028.1 hypothetical protein [Rhodomicrobium sp. Az07]